jgi:amidohydrolase
VAKRSDSSTAVLKDEEETGLPYASMVTATDSEGNTVSMAHACGHDMHVTWLVGATTLLARARGAWHGTLMAMFQPAGETASGARAMIDDGLFTRFFKPAAVLGQHVMVGPASVLGWRSGISTSASDSLQVRLIGRGAHGSMPQASIDLVVMAAATVMRLQTIVSREVAATEAAVVTASALQAGTKENMIRDEAILKLNVRTFDGDVRTRVLVAIKRIIDAFCGYLPSDRVREVEPTSAGEDFGANGTASHAPSVFWFVDGTDPDTYKKAAQARRLNDLPTNHHPRFAPVIHPTQETGVETLVVAAESWLAA